jgi:hypothetical protein
VAQAVGLGLVLAMACEDNEAEGDETGEPATSTTDDPVAERTCIAPAGLGAPDSVQDVVDLINAFPRPVSLPCFLESLDRPLQVYASSSEMAAQPAVGERSPRIFIGRGDLILSVVPEGIGRPKLEISLLVADRKSVKAEVEFPVVEMLTPASPYDAVRNGSAGTTCGVCHLTESRYMPVTEAVAYQSDALQDPEQFKLPTAFAAQHARDCDPDVEPDRCAMLTSIFSHGEVQSWDIPRDLKICQTF